MLHLQKRGGAGLYIFSEFYCAVSETLVEVPVFVCVSDQN